jgi:UDP-glucose 4-epimerase
MVLLVTGGAGFIGSNLVEDLVDKDGEVTVLDSLHTGSLDNLNDVKDRIKIVVGDIKKLPHMKLANVDGIFHFGIPSSSPMYKDNPMLVGDAINDMIGVLEFARKNDSRVVFASSSSVYNDQEPPHREEMNIKVRDYYTEARLCMERLANLYNRLYGVGTIALRLFSIYGPHEKSKGRYANLVSQFLWEMRKGGAPLIFGDGEQSRDFVYVKDVVRAAIMAFESKIKFDIFNVGTGKSYTLNQLVDLLNDVLGTSIKPKYVENPIKNYVSHTLADTSKAEKLLNFRYKYALEEGMRLCIKSLEG